MGSSLLFPWRARTFSGPSLRYAIYTSLLSDPQPRRKSKSNHHQHISFSSPQPPTPRQEKQRRNWDQKETHNYQKHHNPQSLAVFTLPPPSAVGRRPGRNGRHPRPGLLHPPLFLRARVSEPGPATRAALTSRTVAWGFKCLMISKRNRKS
jgi:hypothetical protein